MCVRKVSQVGAKQARIELQVVILEWLGTAAKLTVHLAQVSQVDRALSQVDKGPTQFAANGLVSMTRHDLLFSFPTYRGVSQGVRKRDFLSDSPLSTYDIESRFRLGDQPDALLFGVGDDIGAIRDGAE